MLKGGPLSSLDLHIDGMVARLTLNRPEKRNAIDPATRAALEQTLGVLDADDAVRVIVLTGAGTAFCAGADLAAAPAEAPVPANRQRLVAPFETFAKPIIAAVNGVAVGGGLEI